MNRSQPCPICRKPISTFEVGIYCESLGARGLWPTSYKNLRELASGDGFNEYFQNQFNGNKATFLRWKEVFYLLEIVGGRGKKQQRKKNDPKKLEILDACVALGGAYNNIRDFDDARRYYKQAKEGYEEQLGRNSEKALDTTHGLIMVTCSSREERIVKLRDLLKMMERALGVLNFVTLDTLSELGCELEGNGEYEEAKEVQERCLAGRERLSGEDHMDTLMPLNTSGCLYDDLKDYEKALEYYERDLKGSERLLGKNLPSTLMTLENIGYLR